MRAPAMTSVKRQVLMANAEDICSVEHADIAYSCYSEISLIKICGCTGGNTHQEKLEPDDQQPQAPRPLLPPDGPILSQQNAGQYHMPGQDLVVVSDSQVRDLQNVIKVPTEPEQELLIRGVHPLG